VTGSQARRASHARYTSFARFGAPALKTLMRTEMGFVAGGWWGQSRHLPPMLRLAPGKDKVFPPPPPLGSCTQ